MAVPKRKTSRSRRDKRRAQHGISAPRVQLCPNCRQPKQAHRMCPNCKQYRGRDVEPLRLQARRDARGMTVRVAVDALGGDQGPEEIAAGALDAASAEIQPILYGPPGLDTHGLPLVEAATTVGVGDRPVDAVRAQPDSSLVRSVRAVADGEADTVVSTGSTGAMLAASLLHIRRLPGVHRPAIAVVLPARNGPSVLIDAGANADARPEHLLQFAHMGSVFAEEILEVETPVVRLLSIGEEDEKGNQLTLDAHALLRASELEFAGNTESRRLLEGDADVVVTDGFTGNVALKALEGTIRTILLALSGELRSSLAVVWAGCSSGPRRAASGSASIPTRTEAPTFWASAASS